VSQQTKRAKEFVSYRQVFPSEANPGGNMFGGRIMEIMDSTAGIAADHFSGHAGAVTASVEALTFRLPVHVGDVLKTVCKVVYTGHTSMVLKVDVHRYEKGLGSAQLCTSAHYIFVAMDDERKPTPVPALEVTTDAEKKAWEIAKAVRAQAIKMKPIG
jgi:acyl-CoA thioesterase YciA